jgi:hypothetical protein
MSASHNVEARHKKNP